MKADTSPAGRTPDDFRPLNRRARLAVLALALATVVGVTVLMLRPHQRLMGAKAAQADAARRLACPSGAASASAGCPGSLQPVVVVPVGPVQSAPGRPGGP